MSNSETLPIRQWIALPAIITLAITLLRLVGELLNWSPRFFSRAGGGGGAVVGIAWLVPILGVYFALKLRDAGHRPKSLGRAFGLLFLAGALPPVAGFLSAQLGVAPSRLIAVICLGFFAAILVAKPAWPALARVLWIYGLAARIPVMLVMLVAIFGKWGTHYDVTSPELTSLSPMVKWLVIGVFPQFTLWMGFTVVVGMFFGVVTIAVAPKKG